MLVEPSRQLFFYSSRWWTVLIALMCYLFSFNKETFLVSQRQLNIPYTKYVKLVRKRADMVPFLAHQNSDRSGDFTLEAPRPKPVGIRQV